MITDSCMLEVLQDLLEPGRALGAEDAFLHPGELVQQGAHHGTRAGPRPVHDEVLVGRVALAAHLEGRRQRGVEVAAGEVESCNATMPMYCTRVVMMGASRLWGSPCRALSKWRRLAIG